MASAEISPQPLTKCPPEYIYFCFAVVEHKLSKSTGSAPRLREFGISTEDSEKEYPLFVTWNKHDHAPEPKAESDDDDDDDDESETDNEAGPHLRGCIGTFSAMPLEEGLTEYARISAFRDTRFKPIKGSELELLQCCVSLLTPMTPIPDPLAWTLGTHGIHITFHDPNTRRKYTATYLPEVPPAQGWTKEETIDSLVKKSGYRGKVEQGGEVWKGMKVGIYESLKGKKDWQDWVRWKEANGRV